MAKEKPKKGGMVLIIGMGTKPPKSKEKVKKAEEEPKKKVRSRGGGKGSENKSRNIGRIRNFKRLMKKNPAHLEEVLEKTRMSKEQLEQFIRLKTGANSFEEAMQQKQDVPGMISEAARMLAGNRGNDPLKNEKLATMLKKKGIPISEFKKYVEKNPFWELEGDFQNLVDRLQGFRGGTTRGARDERPRGRVQRREARRASREMAQEADEEARDEQGYTDHELQTMTNILSASMPIEQARRMAAKYLDTGSHGPRFEPKDSREHGFYLQGAAGGTPYTQPSTLFTQPRTVGVKLSSPQEEEAEDPVDYGTTRKSSDNPIDLAWAILKGNPAMKDAHGQNIDNTAAALYDNLAAHGGNAYTRADVLDAYREMAQDDTSAQMQHQDPEHGRNYGIERQDRHEVEHPNQSSRVKALLDLLERGGDVSALQLRMAQQQDKERDFGNPNLAPSQPTGTDAKMKPGNVMDLM